MRRGYVKFKTANEFLCHIIFPIIKDEINFINFLWKVLAKHFNQLSLSALVGKFENLKRMHCSVDGKTYTKLL
jgi:hypothetical protein